MVSSSAFPRLVPGQILSSKFIYQQQLKITSLSLKIKSDVSIYARGTAAISVVTT